MNGRIFTDRPPRILMFSTGFAPYLASENLTSSKLALAMLNRGWQLDVISAPDEAAMYGAEWHTPWLPLKPITHEIQHPHGSRFGRLTERIGQSVRLGHPIPGLRWAYAALEKARELYRQKSYDFIISRFLDEHAHLPALVFAQETHIPWLANWNDPPGHHFPPPYHYPRPLFRRLIWDRYYRDAARKADCNTFPCEKLAEHMSAPLGLSKSSKMEIIPHIGLEGYVPKSRPATGIFSLCHAGNLSAERSPAVLLKALRKFLNEDKPDKPVHLKIIGVENSELGQLLDELDLRSHVDCNGGMGYMSSLEELAGSSVTVIVEAPCKSGIFLPGKLADYATTNRPVFSLSPCEGTVKDYIDRHGGGLVVDCKSVADTHLGLRTLYNAWCEGSLDNYVSFDLRRALGADAAIDKYKGIFEQLK